MRGAVIAAVATGVGLGLLLWAERRESRTGKVVVKPLTSAGFIVTAVLAGALNHGYGQAVLVALVLSWVGDVCLLGRGRAPFLAGLVAFLLGHVAFAVAFVVRGVDHTWALAAVVPVALAAAFVLRSLQPRIPPALQRPVLAYVAVISFMVILAVGTFGALGGWIVPVAAVVFWLSDVSVALDRFAGAGFANRAWGLPAYYVAQLLFAFSVFSQVG